MRSTRATLLGLFLFAVCACAVNAEDSSQLSDRLHQAEELSRIDDPSLSPWYLKVSFQLFDAKGKPAEQGTIEEWWRSPSSFKTVYTSPSYTATEIETPDGLYRTKGASSPPYLLALVLRQLVHPLLYEDIAEITPDLRKETFGKIPLDCIMLSQPIKHVPFPPFGLFPTYRFDRDGDTLRASFNFGTEVIVHNNIGKFQQRMVSTSETVSVNSVDAISAHIDTLRTQPLSDNELAPSTDLEKEDSNPTKVASGVMAGLILSQAKPIYPERAKANHATGSVLMRARIGKDGHIHTLKLVSVPDPDLAIAAIAAVRQWTYKPYTLNGEPVEVDTTITVNFNIAP
jgi:TonB family protein